VDGVSRPLSFSTCPSLYLIFNVTLKIQFFAMQMLKSVVAFSCALAVAEATNFTIISGQIFTPGLAIVDAPQPNTPLGGRMFISHT
jgi:hypothetical protein